MKPAYVSIIVIGHNIETYVAQCLQSVLAIDYPKYEIIFVDDGSTDHTFAIADALLMNYMNHEWGGRAHRPVRIRVDPNRRGIISARKTGLQIAEGEYVMFVDGDDYVNEGILQSLTKWCDVPNRGGHAPDIVISGVYKQWRSDGAFIASPVTKTDGFLDAAEYRGLLYHMQLPHNMFPRLYRTEFLRESGYCDFPNLTMAEDLYTNMRLALCDPAVYLVSDINYYYCCSRSSLSRTDNGQSADTGQTLRMLADYLTACEIPDRERIEIMQLRWDDYAAGILLGNYSDATKTAVLRQYEDNRTTERWIFGSSLYRKALHIYVLLHLRCPAAAAWIDRKLIPVLRKLLRVKRG